MANNVMFNVNPTFNMNAFSARLAEVYRMKGYTVNVAFLNGSSIITFEKNVGGINTVLGMGEGVKATCMLNNGVLAINFTDAEWTGKVIGLVVGWFMCLIPFVTALIGTSKQLQLPKSIANDATMIAASM